MGGDRITVRNLKVAKVDVDQNQRIASQFSIRSIPSLYVFKGGEIVAQQVGAVPKSAIAGLIDRAL